MRGETGGAGVLGSKGEKGDPGLTGSQGPLGIKGAEGPPGPKVNIHQRVITSRRAKPCRLLPFMSLVIACT